MRSSEVDLLCLDDGNPILLPKGVRRLRVVPNASKLARIIRVLFGALRGYPIGPEFYNSLSLLRILAGIDLTQYDLLYVTQLPLHRLRLQHPRIVYDAVDCWSHKCQVMAANLTGYQSLVYRFDSILAPRHEVAACNTAHVVLAAAEREAAHLRTLGVRRPVMPFMHGRPASVPPRPHQERSHLIISFHGKLSYKPNEIALSILNYRVVPRLDQRRFDFRIIGQCPAKFPAVFPNLRFTGYVDSMSDVLSESDLSVFPLTISVGFPNKALESLSAGVPFIATPGVIEGLPAMPELFERGVYVREIDEFPAEIERFSRLSVSERQEISDQCRRSVERTCNQSARDAQWDTTMLELEQSTGAFTSAALEAQHSSLAASGIR
jgi:glycosyltransferase involved in cell wall biosynthesis